MTEQQIREFSFRDEHIPEHMIGGVLRYFNDHIKPGDFLTSLLGNDLREACCRADSDNLDALPTWVAFLHNEAPWNSYGSPDWVEAWLAMRQEDPPEDG